MYDFTGQNCPICKRPLSADADIVVCPICGAPYHRSCYEVRGACAYEDKHSEGFEWKPAQLHTEAAPAENRPTAAENPAPNAASQNGQPAKDRLDFDYSQLYGNSYTPPESSSQATDGYAPAIDPNSTVEGIPVSDWSAFIGKSHYIYLMLFKQMELLHRRAAVSFSATLFGPFYFIYRKAWKPAITFTLLELITSIPSILYILCLSESPFTTGISADFVYRLSAAAGVLNFAFVILRGLYGFHFYKNSCISKIQQIRAQYPDDTKREYVLRAQGGTSWPAVFGLAAFWFILMFVIVQLFAGPNLAAVYSQLV